MESAWIAALTAVAVLSLQSFVSYFGSRAQRRRELLIDAYGDFLSGVTGYAVHKPGTPGHTEAAERLIRGRQKIVAYGPKGVVQALARFDQTSTVLSDSAAQAALVGVTLEMRRSLGVGGDDLESEIKLALFGKENGKRAL